MSRIAAAPASARVTKYSAWRTPPRPAKRGVSGARSRKANSPCTPVWTTRTSCSSSTRLRSQRSSSVSRRCPARSERGMTLTPVVLPRLGQAKPAALPHGLLELLAGHAQIGRHGVQAAGGVLVAGRAALEQAPLAVLEERDHLTALAQHGVAAPQGEVALERGALAAVGGEVEARHGQRAVDVLELGLAARHGAQPRGGLLETAHALLRCLRIGRLPDARHVLVPALHAPPFPG